MTNLNLKSTAPHIKDPANYAGPLRDTGIIPTMLEGRSQTHCLIMSKGSHDESETGIWTCTPGYWTCHVTADEFCHFLKGRATYVHENGDVIQIEPGTAAFFPKDWKGTCRVHETVRKVYMIR